LTISRRRLFQLMKAAAGATAGVGIQTRLRRLGINVAAADAKVPAPLSSDCTATLVSLARALVGDDVEVNIYRQFFGWRAEHLPGIRDAYEELARQLDIAARKRHGLRFAESDLQGRATIIHDLVDPSPDAVIKGALTSTARAVRADVFALYAGTDAWLALGYDDWPGVPRGLEGYQHLPQRAMQKNSK
jgi:hypothetical protein